MAIVKVVGKQKKPGAYYVDNKALYDNLVAFKKEVRKAKKLGLERPRIPEKIGRDIYLIATKLSTMPSFARYPFRDDMISDGIENCIVYIDNFNPVKYSKPFAYFTKIICYAFFRRIYREKKQLYIKHKVLEMVSMTNDLEDHSSSDQESDGSIGNFVENEKMHQFVREFEKTLTEKKEKRKMMVRYVPKAKKTVKKGLKYS